MASGDVEPRFWSDDAPGLPGLDGVWRHAESRDERERKLGIAQQQFVPPDGCSDLIVQLRGGRFERAFLQEPTLGYELVEIAPDHALLGVRFDIGVGGALLRRGGQIAGDAERLLRSAEVGDLDGALARLTRFAAEMVERFGAGRPVWLDEVLRLSRRRHGAIGVPELARAAGVSERTLQRGFWDWVGSGPKQLLRALRIREAVALARAGHAPAEIAAELRFADQAHLSREMRELWGTTPGRLRSVSDFFKTDAGAAPKEHA